MAGEDELTVAAVGEWENWLVGEGGVGRIAGSGVKESKGESRRVKESQGECLMAGG